MDIEKRIKTILSYKFVKKVNKYIVKIAFEEGRAKEFWLSERQLTLLEHHLDKTPNGHSTDAISIYGVFKRDINGKTYYGYSKVEYPLREKPVFCIPEQHDLTDLVED